MSKIKWHYEGEPGFWHSVDGRFEISPRFRHTVNPDSYQLRDTVIQSTTIQYTIRDAKARAERTLTRYAAHLQNNVKMWREGDPIVSENQIPPTR